MNNKFKITLAIAIVALLVVVIFFYNQSKGPSPSIPTLLNSDLELPDSDLGDQAMNDELNIIFKEADDHFVKGDFDKAIKSYKKISENPKYSMVDYGEFVAPGLAESSIEEVKCVQKYELSKIKRTPEETVKGILQNLHDNTPEVLDFISCRVCESAWLDSTCNFLDRDSVPAVLLGKDLDRGMLAKINVGAKTFIKEESSERGILYRITNETPDTNDDVLLHLGSHPFAPDRYRVEDIYRMEK